MYSEPPVWRLAWRAQVNPSWCEGVQNQSLPGWSGETTSLKRFVPLRYAGCVSRAAISGDSVSGLASAISRAPSSYDLFSRR